MKTIFKVTALGLILGLSVIVSAPTVADTFAYVTNRNSNSVSVINTTSNAVVATVPVGNTPIDVAITPDGAFAYVANAFSNNVSVIDTATNSVVATIGVGTLLQSIAITPDGAFAWVTVRGFNTPSGGEKSVAVIDTSTNTVVTTVTVGTFPTGIAITPNGAFTYVTNSGSASVSVIDTAANAVVATIPVHNVPVQIAITPDGAFAYVTHGSNIVSVIDTATNSVSAWRVVLGRPAGVAITPDGAFAYVATETSDAVVVFTTPTTSISATVPVGDNPVGVAVAPDGAVAYVSNRFSNTVSVINTATNSVDFTIPVGTIPEGIAFTPESDSDGDGVPDDQDNAPNDFNPDQSDVDGDEIADVIDPCPSDLTNTCDPSGSASESIGFDGGTVATEDGAVAVTIPAGSLDDDTSISITDTGEDFVLSSDVGQALALFGVEIQPEGIVFNVPITLVFAWDDVDNDGQVDGTNILEKKLIITKDGVAITDQCQFEPLCDRVANKFTFLVTSLSEFTLAGPLDTDNDGIPDDFAGQVDVCPLEDATGFDVDDNGCIDSFSGLLDLLFRLLNEGVISEQMVISLTSKMANAENSFDKDKICTAVNQLEAFKNQVAAQLNNKISPEAASLVTDYADSVILFLESQLPIGETC